MENNNTQFTMSADDVVQGMFNDSKFHLYNLPLAIEVGLNEAILLSKLVKLEKHWREKEQLDNEGMFFRTIEDIFEETALTKKQQATAIKNLESLGLIKTKRKGLPARRFFLLEKEEIAKTAMRINKKCQKVTTDTYAVSETQEPQEPHTYQKSPKGTTRGDQTEQLEVTKGDAIKELKELELKELKVLEEEEEEEERGSELFEFLISNDIDREDAQSFENGVLKLNIVGYTNEQVLRSIDAALADLNDGNCFAPYGYAPKKLKYIMQSDAAAAKRKPKEKPRKHTREESVPEWHNKPGQVDKPQKPELTKEQVDAKRAALQAKLEKMRKEGQE